MTRTRAWSPIFRPAACIFPGFTGLDADGDWTLFVADLSDGDVATLDNWSLVFIPEPSSTVLVMFGAAAALIIRKRDRRSA